MKEVYIVFVVCMFLGSFGGVFVNVLVMDFGVVAIRGVLEKVGVDVSQVEEVFMGNVCLANFGQVLVCQVVFGVGILNIVFCMIVNKVCFLGVKVIMFGVQFIMLGYQGFVVVGGMENMSVIFYYVFKVCYGYKYGYG